MVRASGDTFYMLYNPAAGGLLLFLRTPGSFTQIGAPTGTVSNGDTIEIRAVGTTIEGFVNGSSRGSVTDATIASGSAGIGGLGSNSSVLDDWEGGNTGAGGGKVTKNTRAWPLGMAIGMNRGVPGVCS